jgi:hypothetical protein
MAKNLLRQLPLSRKELGPIEVGLLGTKANIWSRAQNKFEAPPRGLALGFKNHGYLGAPT